ncbi:hypothetical protein B0I35DRAFT_418165 [Stachybotrys elegans]|uniref:Uncharacterized protein n=1 Tax=Stachybotrys elegans TaxID=80388 RepID=A0A8K0WWJ4_9HYPO|nr:hypothetical protein B0I35DRAFT_418165 [Stachybotrys elegans]
MSGPSRCLPSQSIPGRQGTVATCLPNTHPHTPQRYLPQAPALAPVTFRSDYQRLVCWVPLVVLSFLGF